MGDRERGGTSGFAEGDRVRLEGGPHGGERGVVERVRPAFGLAGVRLDSGESLTLAPGRLRHDRP